MPLKEAVFLGVPLKGPDSDPREPFEGFSANANRSEGTGVPDPEIVKGVIEELFPLSE